MTEQEKFEAWWHEPDQDSGQSYDDCYGQSTAIVAWLAWQAAVNHEREEIAKIFDNITQIREFGVTIAAAIRARS